MLIQKDLLNKLIDLASTSIEYLNEKDDITWITVKGNRIPIKKGETAEDAIKSFIEGKSKEKKTKPFKIGENFSIGRQNYTVTKIRKLVSPDLNIQMGWAKKEKGQKEYGFVIKKSGEVLVAD